MQPDERRIGTRTVIALASASLLAGAATPWITAAPTTVEQPAAGSVRTNAAASPTPPAAQRTVPAVAPRPRGIIAIGNDTMLAATPCLEQRGIDVYPRAVETPADLHRALDRLGTRHAAYIIHMGEQEGLVDGQIQQVLDRIGSARRVVWATIRVPGSGSGGFSFEDRTNASIRNVVGRSPEGRVLEWRELIDRKPGLTVDGIRLSEAGCTEYAQRVGKLSGRAPSD